jgi:hypothetical protein
METYLDQAICSALKIKALFWSPLPETLSSLYAVIMLGLLVAIPVLCWILLIKFKSRLNDKSFEHRFGAAYENIRTSSTTALGYTSVFMIKRFAFTSFLFLIKDKRTLQIMLLIWLLVICTAYTWEAEPFTEALCNL